MGEFSVAAFQDYFQALEDCCLDEKARTVVDEAGEVLQFVKSVPDEAIGVAVFRTRQGGYFTLEEWQDYTGHGCRCGCELTGPFDTYDGAVRFGLTKNARERLGIPEPEGPALGY
jgi:hypothetical protein